MHATRVLLVDDDPLAIQTLSLYFSRTDDFKIAGTASNGIEALEKLKCTPVDVMLVDIHMPGMNGLALQQEILKLPRPPVFLAITSIDNNKYIMRTVQNGGAGYILKSQSPESIIQAVRDASRGKSIVSPHSRPLEILQLQNFSNTRQHRSQPWGKAIERNSSLSAFEEDVLSLLGDGFNDLEIAHRLNYSQASIKEKISYLLREFQATSRIDLISKIFHPRR